MVSERRAAAPALGAQERDDAQAAEAGQLLCARLVGESRQRSWQHSPTCRPPAVLRPACKAVGAAWPHGRSCWSYREGSLTAGMLGAAIKAALASAQDPRGGLSKKPQDGHLLLQ